MKTLITLVALLLLVATLSTACGTTTATTKCAEDDPCWNCHTMGNKICG